MKTKVPFGLSSWIGFVAAAAAGLVPLVGELADATAPLGTDPKVWTLISAGLLTVTVLGRMWQDAKNAIGNATVGYGTIFGLAGAAAAVVIPLIGSLADASSPFGIPQEFWVKTSAVLAGVVVLGRMGTVAVGGGVPPVSVPDEVPVDDDTEFPPDEGSAGDEVTPGLEV